MELSKAPDKCPFCDNDDLIDQTGQDWDPGVIIDKWDCACGASWENHYGYSHTIAEQKER